MVHYNVDLTSFRDKPFQSGKLFCINHPDTAAESISFSSHVSLFALPQTHGCNPQMILMSRCTTLLKCNCLDSLYFSTTGGLEVVAMSSNAFLLLHMGNSNTSPVSYQLKTRSLKLVRVADMKATVPSFK